MLRSLLAMVLLSRAGDPIAKALEYFVVSRKVLLLTPQTMYMLLNITQEESQSLLAMAVLLLAGMCHHPTALLLII